MYARLYIVYPPWGGRGGTFNRGVELKKYVVPVVENNNGFSSRSPWGLSKREYMTYFVIFLGICFMLGVLAVASNPSPYYGVLGLVLASVVGCGWLVSLGVSFISLVLFIVYLGGMLVVFVYSVSLAADPYPQAWGD